MPFGLRLSASAVSWSENIFSRVGTPYLVCAPGLRSLENAQEAENGFLVLCRSTASEESPLGLLGRLDR
jgi:hypothetical protein